MPSNRQTSRFGGYAADAGLSIVALGLVFLAADQPEQRISHSTGAGVAAVVTGVAAGVGLAFAGLIRLLAGRVTGSGAWLRRAAVGTAP